MLLDFLDLLILVYPTLVENVGSEIDTAKMRVRHANALTARQNVCFK